MRIRFCDKGTVAETALRIRKKVNLGELCRGKNMIVSNFPLKDGSTIKFLENAEEVDCLVMKNGKVITAKGRFFDDEKEAADIASSIVERKIANRSDVVDSYIGEYEYNDVIPYRMF